MAVYDDEKIHDENPLAPNDEGQHEDLGVHPERREAEVKQLEDAYGRNPSSASGDSKSLSPDALGHAESNTASSTGSGSNTYGDFGGGFWKGGATSSKVSGGGRLKGVFTGPRRRRNLIIGGGLGGGVVALIFFGFAAIVPYELVHIESNLLGYESKSEQHLEKDAAQKVLKRLIKKASGKTQTERQADAKEEAADGEELASDMDSFDFTDPTVVSALEGQGIKVNMTNDEFTGLTDTTTGEPITADDIASDDALFDRFETALPEWDVGQLESFRPLMTDEAGASFDILSDSNTKNAQDEISDAIENGANAEDIASASAEESDSAPPDKDSSAADQQAYQSEADSSQLEAAIKTVEADEAKGDSETEAINDAASDFHLGTALLWGAIATGICEVKEAADVGAKDRVPTIITALIRHATTTFSLADQLKTGQITGQEVNQTMQIFNGDSSASQTNSDGTTNEAALPFSSSAGWQRATGNPVTSNTPDIDPSAEPTANAGQQVVNEIDEVFNYIPGATPSCSVLTSRWGIFVQIGLGAAQLLSTVFSGGEVDADSIAAGTLANSFLQRVVIPDIIKYFTPVGISGHEDSVQWFNNADAGANLAFGNYSRRLGALPMTNTAADTLTAEATNDQVVANSQKSWTDRTFAISNPYSLVSHLANDLPIGLDNNVTSIASYLTSLPKTLLHGIASIFDSRFALAAAPPTNPGQPYGITQYGLSDDQVDKYDPISNEQYLFSSVSYGGKSVKRIDALGNPNTYTDSAAGDSNNNDLLHCFVDSFAIIEEADTGTGADQNCGSIGDYDYTSDTPAESQTLLTNLNQTIASIYCNALGAGGNSVCIQQLAQGAQTNNDALRFSQYLMDTHVMSDYMSLTTNQ